MIALSIAGSDSGGGAGIQADLKSFSALGAYGATVLTAITAQNTRGVTGVELVSPEIIAAQIDAVFGDLDVRAVKIGMLGSAEIVRTVAAGLGSRNCPVVVDPVVVAKSGDVLLSDDATGALRAQLLPHCALLTPNLPEAARLLEDAQARSEEEMIAQGKRLLDLGPENVLMKGGHMDGQVCVDLLVTPQEVVRLASPRIHTRNTHGTGCSLSAAIAALIARGHSLRDAVADAHFWLHEAIRAADSLQIGSGCGPVHHFHAIWPALAGVKPEKIHDPNPA